MTRKPKAQSNATGATPEAPAAAPSTTAANGRGPGGRFGPGNKFSKGNPLAARVAKLRAALLGAVTEADLRAVVKRLLQDAKAGDVAACKELLQRVLGPADALDLQAELAELRAAVNELMQRGGFRPCETS